MDSFLNSFQGLNPSVQAAIVSGIVALFTVFYTYYRTDRQKQQYAVDLERLKSELSNSAMDRNARRDYEYEARKKLYEQYEPLFFRFSESTDSAYYRIKSLANRAAEGKLDPKTGWLQRDGYYLQSTMYYLMAPLANYKLMRSKITYVDLRVDTGIYSTYILGRILFVSFSEAFAIARKMEIEYDPYKKDNPDVRQDLPIGMTENIAELMIESDQTGARKVMNLAKFQDVFQKDGNKDLDIYANMLHDFHPKVMPVLWRVLMVQLVIYEVVKKLVKVSAASSKQDLINKVKEVAENLDPKDFNWCSEEEKKNYPEDHVRHQFEQSRDYIASMIEAYY